MILQARNLEKKFRLDRKRHLYAVDGVSFAMAAGEVLGLVGESGSGKSTLGRLLVGLLDKSGGEVVYRQKRLPDRYRPADFRRLASRMQMIFQDPNASLNPRMTVQEIIGEGLRLGGMGSARQRRERVVEWLTRVGLRSEHLSRYPHEFSGGQRQRIGIARALALEPEFLVCDEPLSALDLSIQAQMIRLLDDLKRSLRLTMLFIAHDLSLVRHVSDRMAVMYLGTLVETGAAERVFFQPYHPYTRLLIAANPVADPTIEKNRRHPPIRGEIGSPIGPARGCRFSPRCPEVHEACEKKVPPMVEVEPGHEVACHLYAPSP